jgi:hypothetical protein
LSQSRPRLSDSSVRLPASQSHLVPFQIRPRSAQDSNCPNHQQPKWKHSQARNRLQSQPRQQQPLPAQYYEKQQRCRKIHHPHDRRQRGRESAYRIGDACDGESKGEPAFGEFESLRNWRHCAGRLVAWFRRWWRHWVWSVCDRSTPPPAEQELLRAVPGMSLDNTFSQVSSASRGGPRAYFRARPPPTASIYFPVGDTSEVKGRTSTRLNLDSTAGRAATFGAMPVSTRFARAG